MRWIAPAVLLVLAACASAPTTMQSASLAAASDTYTVPGMLVSGATLGSTNPIAYAPHETVWEVLYRRNPRLLSDRSTRGGLPSGDDPIGVYVGDHYMGGPDVLKSMFARDVFRVVRLTASEAQTRYPRHHDNGVILVTMRRE